MAAGIVTYSVFAEPLSNIRLGCVVVMAVAAAKTGRREPRNARGTR
jgi:hypothetical protein